MKFERDLIATLKAASEKTSQKRVADQLGISEGYLSDVLKRRRDVSLSLGRKLGYEKVAVFVKPEESLATLVNLVRIEPTCIWLSNGTKIVIERDGMKAELRIVETPTVEVVKK